jgi:hypothetical protein
MLLFSLPTFGHYLTQIYEKARARLNFAVGQKTGFEPEE